MYVHWQHLFKLTTEFDLLSMWLKYLKQPMRPKKDKLLEQKNQMPISQSMLEENSEIVLLVEEYN